MTYNLHIIVRFELEQALLTGDLAVADLPAAWNQKYRETLGVTPANDAEGCLQDIHWSAGLIGYFPTYTLGNLYAAQLFAQADAELGGLDEAFARGDFSGLLGWLRTKVHSPGPALPARGTDRAHHRLEARPPPADRRPAAEVRRALRNLTTRLSPSTMSPRRLPTRPRFPPALPPTAKSPPRLPPSRLASIDAYRGLVMFLMMAEVLRSARGGGRGAG